MAMKIRRDGILKSQDLTMDNESHPKPIQEVLYMAKINDLLRRTPYELQNLDRPHPASGWAVTKSHAYKNRDPLDCEA